MLTIARLRRVALLLAGTAALGYGAFLLGRPALETRLRARLEQAARARGLALEIGRLRLTPWLGLELFDVSLARAGRLELVTSAVDVRPLLSPWSFVRPGVELRVAAARVRLPRGIELDLLPSRWALVRVLRGWRLQRQARGELLSATLTRSAGGRRLELRATNARPSGFVRLLVNGCSLGEPGSLDGEGRLEEDAAGRVRLALRGRARGAALASVAAAGSPACEQAAAGMPTDAEAEAEALLDRGAGALRVDRLRLAAAGAEISGRLAVDGGRTRPQIDLSLQLARLDLARLLAAAGLEPAADELGVVSLSLGVRGPLLEPSALVVSQQLDYTPPQRVPAAITRLRGPFVHHSLPRNGRRTAILVSPESPDFLPLAEVPPLFVSALLLGEDAGFFGHRGLDLRELPAALATNLARGRIARGGSTLSQQLAKNLFLSSRRTIARKLEEAAFALLLDSTLGKERELEIYLNVIEWGPGVYGVRPAARHYFGKELSELTPRQMALLVCLIPGPIKYQHSLAGGVPTPFFEGLMQALLEKLAATGALEPEEQAAAAIAPLDLRGLPTPTAPAPEESPDDEEEPPAPPVDGGGTSQ